MDTTHTRSNDNVLTVTAVGLLVTLVALLWHNTSATAQLSSDAVATTGDYTILSANGGNEDVVLVLDNRNEELLAYRVRNQNQVELLQKASLAELFERGKAGETRGR